MIDLSLPQDPAELFDLVTFDGRPLGRKKPRGQVHRDGDWHKAVHVWVVGENEEDGPFLTFQRRSIGKDTWPGKLDATVGGHYRAGEGLQQTLREVDEEIGVQVWLEQLHFMGRRVSINESEPGVVDRELQDVFFLRDVRRLDQFRPSPAELAALIRIQVKPALEFLSGRREKISATSFSPGSTAIETVEITADDFIPQFDRYFYRVAIAASRFLAGDTHVAV